MTAAYSALVSEFLCALRMELLLTMTVCWLKQNVQKVKKIQEVEIKMAMKTAKTEKCYLNCSMEIAHQTLPSEVGTFYNSGTNV